jgi:hypothetical protein
MKKVIVCLSVINLFLAGCSKTDEETERKKSTPNTVATPVGCDTVNMKFSANIQPIITANCISCHNSVRANLNVRLDTYEGVKQQATRLRNTISVLIGVTSHADGFTPMPYNKPKLSDCDINKIRSWVNRNSPNN